MTKIADLLIANSGGNARDAAIVPGYDAAEATTANVGMTVAQIRATTRDETLDNKQINVPGAIKAGYFGGMQVPGGKLTGIVRSIGATLTIPSTASNAESDITITISGVTTAHNVSLTFAAALPVGLGLMGVQAGTDEIVVRIRNFGGATYGGGTVSINILALLVAAADAAS